MPRGPDGRTVLTDPEALNSYKEPVVECGSIYAPFIPETNTIEALNRQLRKAIKTKGHFPNEDAARKLIYLAVANAVRRGPGRGTGPSRCWRCRSTSVTDSRTQHDTTARHPSENS
jgi:transposase-like protein